MAFNPPVTNSGLPLRVDGEFLVLQRKNVEIEVKVDGTTGKKTAKGTIFITTARAVFVCDKKDDIFISFDIPFGSVYGEKYQTPLFGSNYLYLRARPLFEKLPGDCEVKLWFYNGGCQKFLKYFMCVLTQIRERKQDGADPVFVNDLLNGSLDSRFGANVDPSDPSTVFLHQPEVEVGNRAMSSYYEPMKNSGPKDQQFPYSNVEVQPNNLGDEYVPKQDFKYAPQVIETELQEDIHPSGIVEEKPEISSDKLIGANESPTKSEKTVTEKRLYPTFASFGEQSRFALKKQNVEPSYQGIERTDEQSQQTKDKK